MAAVARFLIITMIAGGAFLCACAAQSADTAPLVESGILDSSIPAAGATVSSPVDELKLRFSPPARLDEVTIDGPDGLMPMMVHAVGESTDYSLPLPGLGPGTYTINWKATTRAEMHQGTVRFTVK